MRTSNELTELHAGVNQSLKHESCMSFWSSFPLRREKRSIKCVEPRFSPKLDINIFYCLFTKPEIISQRNSRTLFAIDSLSLAAIVGKKKLARF